MHPLFLQRRNLILLLLAALAGGVCLALLLRVMAILPPREALAYALPLTVAYAFACLSAWWVCRANPVTGSRAAHAVLVQLGAALQAGLMWVGLGALWAIALREIWHAGPQGPNLVAALIVLFVAGIPLYLISALVHYLFVAVAASHAAERRALETDVTAREAELRALRAQLDPHFLFNSLNSINALIGSDPEAARRMCERLGDFMRHTLRLGGKHGVPLREELALVDRYLDIEQVRFGERLRVEREIDAEATGCVIPPLLLQPLVENAIKHGVAQRLAGGTIRLAVRRRGGELVLSVENPVDGDTPLVTGEGVGLENVRRRLRATAADDGYLTAGRVQDSYRVTLTLPVRGAEDPES